MEKFEMVFAEDSSVDIHVLRGKKFTKLQLNASSIFLLSSEMPQFITYDNSP